jgi:hypothetical protein
MHRPALALHAPDWQRLAVAVVQPVAPSEIPHFPLWHVFVVHWFAAVHAAPTAAAQVFVAALQTPAAHTTSAPGSQTPVRTPSLGIAAPGASLARHARLACSQYCEAPQSLSA